MRIVRRVTAKSGMPGNLDTWPATIPAVRSVLTNGLTLGEGVTLLVGENGSGKSTLVEAIAAGFGLAPEGGTRYGSHVTRPSESPLVDWIGLEKEVGAPKWGFFLRAETMHGYFTYLEDVNRDRPDSIDLHTISHGESFLEILRTHFNSLGFYCLDEPEAALSFSAQIALVATLHDLASSGGQILCATHSPIVASLPGARVLEVGDWGLRETTYAELELVGHWRRYLDDPMRYLRHVLDAD